MMGELQQIEILLLTVEYHDCDFWRNKRKSLFAVLDHLMLWALEKNETVQLFETKMMEDLVMVEPVSGTAQSALLKALHFCQQLQLQSNKQKELIIVKDAADADYLAVRDLELLNC
ncbi:hypothetical protein QYF36_005584 [Acer negundo]|nr:hypothetical protein QYF36_005584 [Acer negundo]